jgi:hypothetical protein
LTRGSNVDWAFGSLEAGCVVGPIGPAARGGTGMAQLPASTRSEANGVMRVSVIGVIGSGRIG